MSITACANAARRWDRSCTIASWFSKSTSSLVEAPFCSWIPWRGNEEVRHAYTHTRADSLHTGLHPFTCDEVVAVTRCARAAEAAHIVFRVLRAAHLLLCHSAVVTLARLSDPHRELPAGGGSQSSQRPAGPVNGRTWLVLDHDVSRGDSMLRAPLTAASSALCA
jgi:hypothetical protein